MKKVLALMIVTAVSLMVLFACGTTQTATTAAVAAAPDRAAYPAAGTTTVIEAFAADIGNTWSAMVGLDATDNSVAIKWSKDAPGKAECVLEMKNSGNAAIFTSNFSQMSDFWYVKNLKVDFDNQIDAPVNVAIRIISGDDYVAQTTDAITLGPLMKFSNVTFSMSEFANDKGEFTAALLNPDSVRMIQFVFTADDGTKGSVFVSNVTAAF